MTASKNAARVAVKAAACPDAAAKDKPQDVFDCMAMDLPREQWPADCLNEATSSVALPTLKQAMLLAVAYAQHSLEHLVRVRLEDEDWDDDDADVDYAVELALDCIKRLREALPEDKSVFDRQWYQAAAAINLCARTFSRTDCYYSRSLAGVKQQFDVLVSAVEFVELEAEHA